MTVETLRTMDETPEANPIVAPAAESNCSRMPLAAIPGDYDGDGSVDIWTQDPCGSWISVGPDYAPGVVATDVLPTDPGAHEHVEFFELPEGAMVLGGASHFTYMLRRTGAVWSDATWFSVPSFVDVRVTRLWAALNLTGAAPEFLFQGNEQLYVVTASESELGIARTLTQDVSPPYTRSFAAFDHLTVVDPAACPDLALGIGVFAAEAGGAGRQVQIVHLHDTIYRATEASLNLDEVTTFSVVQTDGEEPLVGVVGRRADSKLFLLGALEGCSDLRILSELEIDFDPRTPPLPHGYDQSFIPVTNAVHLVGFAIAGTARFTHYDGFHVWTVVASESGAKWELEERRREIHSQRNDSSFSGRVSSIGRQLRDF